jgi:hypothetical protein
MNPRYLILLTTLVFLGFSGSAAAHPCQGPGDTHKHCPTDTPGTDIPAEYTAELTVGGFEFGKLKGLTANRKGMGLPGNEPLEMEPAKPGGTRPVGYNLRRLFVAGNRRANYWFSSPGGQLDDQLHKKQRGRW